MEQETCQKCGMIIDNTLNNCYGFCSFECYYAYMAENYTEKLSIEYWDWS